jgi:hypothetical protein
VRGDVRQRDTRRSLRLRNDQRVSAVSTLAESRVEGDLAEDGYLGPECRRELLGDKVAPAHTKEIERLPAVRTRSTLNTILLCSDKFVDFSVTTGDKILSYKCNLLISYISFLILLQNFL